MANVGTAKVTIEADFRKFESDMDSFFGKTGKSAGKALDDGVKDGAAKAEKAAQEVAKSTEKSVDTASAVFGKIKDRAGKAATEGAKSYATGIQGVGEASKKAADEAGSAMSSVASAAGKAGADSSTQFRAQVQGVQASAATVASSVSDSFSAVASTAGKAGADASAQFGAGVTGVGSAASKAASTAGESLSSVASAAGKAGAESSTRFGSQLSGIGSAASRAASVAGSSFATVTSAAGRAASAASTAFSNGMSGLGSSASRAASAAGNAFTSIGSAAGRAAQSVRTSLNKALDEAAEKSSGLPGKLAGVGGAMAAIAGPAVALKGGFDRLMNIQRAEIVFKNIGLSAEETKNQMARLTEQVTGTSVSLADAAKYSGMFAQAGVELGKPMDSAIDAFTSLSSIAEGSGVDVGRVLSQISAQGKVSGEDLAQMADAGVNATKYLADSMGMSQADVKAAVSDGKVSFQQFVDAVNSGTGTLAKDMGQTLPAKISNFKTALSSLGAAALEQFVPMITAVVEFGTTLLKNAVGPLKQFGQWMKSSSAGATVFKGVMIGIATAVGAAFTLMGVNALVSGAKTAAGWTLAGAAAVRDGGKQLLMFPKIIAGWVKTAFMATVSAVKIAAAWLIALGPVGLLIAAIVAVIGIVVALALKFQWMRDILSAVWDGIKTAAEAAWDGVMAAAQPVIDFMGRVVDAVKGVWDILTKGDFTGGIFGLQEDSGFVDFLFGIRDAAAGVFEWLRDAWSNLTAFFTSDGFLSALATGFGMLVDVGKQFWEILKNLGSALADAGKSIGSSVWSSLQSVFSSLVTVGKALFSVISTVVGALWKVIQAVAPVLLPVLKVIGIIVGGVIVAAFFAFIGALQVVAKVVSVVAGVFSWLVEHAIAPLISILGTVVGFLTGVVAGAFQKFAGLVSGVFSVIGSVISGVWDFLQSSWESVGRPAVDMIVDAFGAVRDFIVGAWDNVKGAFTAVWEFLQAAWESVGVPIFETIQTVIGIAIDAIVIGFKLIAATFEVIWISLGKAWETFGQPILDFVVAAFQFWWDGIRIIFGYLQDAWNVLWGWLQIAWYTVGQPVVDAVKNAFQWMWDSVQMIFGWLKDRFTDMVTGFQIMWNTVGQPVVDAVVRGFNWLRDGITNALNWVKDRITDAGNKIRDLYSTYVRPMVDNVVNGFNKVKDTVTGWKDKIVGALSDAGSWLKDTGKNIVQGLLDGLGDAAKNIGSFFLDKIPGWIKGPFKKALGINSPSRVFAGYGKNIGQGLVNGVDSMQSSVQKATQALADSAGNVDLPDLTVAANVDVASAASSVPSQSLSAPGVTGMGAAGSDPSADVSADPSADFATAAAGMSSTAASLLTPMWAQQNLDMQTWGTTAVTQATGVVAPALSSVGASALLMQTTQWTPAMVGMSTAFTSTAATTAMQAGGVMNPALNSVAATSWNVLNTGVNPAMAGMRGAALQTAGTFGQAAGMIAQQWSAVREATAAPVRFAINSVFNDGIVGMWNSVSDMLGTSKMGTYPVRFASGGYVRGPGGPTADRIPALLSNKEFVLNAKTVKQFGHKNLAALNSGKIGLADGVLNNPGEAKAMMRDKTFRRVASRYRTGGIVQGSPAWKDLLRGYEWARQRNGRPYVWGGSANGGGGADCSGFMSGIANVILGGNGARQWTTYSFPGGQPFVPGLASGFSVGVSSEHTAGTIGGVPGIPAVNVESGGINSRMKFGTSDAAGADDSQFPRKAHLAYTGDGKFLPGAGGGASIGQIIAGMTKEAADKMRAAAAAWQSSHPGLINTYPSALAKTLGDATQKKIDKLVEEMMAFSAGNAESYRGMIKAAYRRQGFQWSQAKEDAWVRQIQSESGGNPLAVQNGYVDVNTGGNEAKGLLQIAGSTWPGCRDPELPDNIFDPWANINAAIRYGERKYGANLLNVIGHGHGYDLGGLLSKTGLFSKQTTEAERVLSPRQTRSFEELVGILGSSAWDQFSATVSRSQSAVPAGGPTRIHEVTQNFYGNTDAEAVGDAVDNRLTRKAW